MYDAGDITCADNDLEQAQRQYAERVTELPLFSTLASASRYAMDVWAAALEPVLERLLSGSPLAELVDGPGLTRALSASFIGLQLFEDVDPEGAARALESLAQLAVLVDVVNDLGPVARRAVRARLRSNRGAARV